MKLLVNLFVYQIPTLLSILTQINIPLIIIHILIP